jgi:hypothetical protein
LIVVSRVAEPHNFDTVLHHAAGRQNDAGVVLAPGSGSDSFSLAFSAKFKTFTHFDAEKLCGSGSATVVVLLMIKYDNLFLATPNAVFT